MHAFKQSTLDTTICAQCKRAEIDHTELAVCDCCNAVGSHELYFDMLMCAGCIEKEKALQSENTKPENQADRVNQMIVESRKIDQSIQLKTDIFNAETTAIVTLRDAINADTTITNKHFTLASEVQTRLNSFQSILFDINQQKIELENKVRFYQVQLNQLATQLSEEEREKIKVTNIEYKPTVKVVKPRKISVKRIDIEELKKYSLQYDVPVESIRGLMVAHNLTAENSAKRMREIMNTIETGE